MGAKSRKPEAPHETEAPVASVGWPLLISHKLGPLFLGVSESHWYRLFRMDELPRPVALEGGVVLFKREDLEKLVRRLPYARSRLRRRAAKVAIHKPAPTAPAEEPES